MGKKKVKRNTEQYKIELKEINDKNGTNIRLKDGVEYLGADIKITHICTCGKEWDVTPNSILNSTSKSCNHCCTFKQWCIDNNREDALNRWDYELNNNKKPSEISYGTKKKYYFKCPRKIHKPELKCINSFTNGQEGSMDCRQCNSFAQFGIDNIGEDFLEKYWDWDKNTVDPYNIDYSSKKNKVWIKCQEKDYHDSYNIFCNEFTNGKRCGYCKGDKIVHPKDSFAQYLIDTYGENALELYWDYKKNKRNPYSYKIKSEKVVYIFCQEKSYHNSYPIMCKSFVNGSRCGYCKGLKVHPLDSLGKILEDKGLLHLWSDKNKKSPYEYKPYSNRKVYWRCPDKKHDDYKRRISESQDVDFRCPECHYSKGEERISNCFIDKGFIKIDQDDFDQLVDDEDKYNKHYYIPQMKFDDLIGLGGGLLSYDFYSIKNNLLIEYQGEQHEKYILGFHNTYDDFLKQLEHDRRKKEYAQKHNIKLLEIWYYDFDRIEEILEREIFNT